MKLTPGKLAGLKKVSNEHGVIAAAAMDQRGSLQKSLGKEKGGEVSDAMMEEFKTLVTEVLTPHASAILLDPEWGLPASKRRAKNAGLLLAYEKTGYDKTGPGRLGDLLDHWSARRLKEAGADCVKILLYYSPYDPKDVNDKKHAWVERIGDECRANDIPYFLEFVGLRRRCGRKRIGLRQEKAAHRHREHARIQQRPLRRRRAEGRSAGEHEVCRRRPVLRRAEGLHEERSHRSLPQGGECRDQAVHLSLGGREQRRVQRDAGTGGRIGSEVQRRALRPRYLERWHSDLCQAGRSSLPQVAGD